MSRLSSHRFRRGASLIEYGLLVGLIGLVAASALPSVGGSTERIFGFVSNSIAGDTAADPAPTAPPALPSCSLTMTISTVQAAAPGVAQVSTAVAGALGSSGCRYALTVEGVPYAYVASRSDTLQDISEAFRVAIAADLSPGGALSGHNVMDTYVSGDAVWIRGAWNMTEARPFTLSN